MQCVTLLESIIVMQNEHKQFSIGMVDSGIKPHVGNGIEQVLPQCLTLHVIHNYYIVQHNVWNDGLAEVSKILIMQWGERKVCNSNRNKKIEVFCVIVLCIRA